MISHLQLKDGTMTASLQKSKYYWHNDKIRTLQ